LRANRVKEIWAGGGAVVSGWLHVPSAYSAEVMAHAGWDSLVIDVQHGAMDFEDALVMMQAISTTQTVPLARVPWNDPGLIMKLLDAGCYGIICPMTNNREEVERFVGACRYPPAGYRSYGPFRASLYGGPDYPEHADEAVVTMAMIETAEALSNLDDIMSVPGLDAVLVGPADLGLSLGLGAEVDRDEPEIVEAIDRVIESARRHGVAPAIFTGSPAYARQMIGKGFQFVSVATDARILASGSEGIVDEVRGG
jgi:4-hydroxy-2-oxoheptanedioate aldolase